MWNNLIDEDVNKNNQAILWNRDASINQAINAWELVHDYQLNPAQWVDVTDDVAVFVRWFKDYDSILRKSSWLDSAQLIDVLIANNFSAYSSDVIVANFFELTSNQQKWISSCQKNNSINRNFIPEQINSKSVDEFSSFNQEIKAAAKWARHKLEEDSAFSIGIVIPELKTRREEAELIFKSIFSPGFEFEQNRADVYQFSVNSSLAETGLVNSALNCLELLNYNFDYQAFSLFLRNDFLSGCESKLNTYAILDSKLRKIAHPNEKLASIIWLLSSLDKEKLPSFDDLVTRLQNLLKFSESLDYRASPTSWCNTFSSALSILGWPDFENLNLSEQSELKQWDQLLTTVCSAGLVNDKLTFPQALSLLKEVAQNSKSKFKTDQSNIKIIDIGETELARFDYAWVTGMSDSILPRNANLNPLIPFGLQRSNNMKFAKNESCRENAEFKFKSLNNLSIETRFSYFKSDQENELRISPLLNSWKLIECQQDGEVDYFLNQNLELESYSDDYGLDVDTKKTSGGTYLLKSQALCPFQSYAQFRLNVEPLQLPQPGLDAAKRGELLHDVLFRIWREIEDQEKLLQLDENQIRELIDKQIILTITKLDSSQQNFSQVEQKRLFELTKSWLELEAKRESFQVISQEYKSTFNINNFEIDIKIDRIDQLADENVLIIDYKTGYASSADWTTERLLDPQLPIYYLSIDNNSHAIAFAKPKDLKFDGLSEFNLNLLGVREVENNNRGNLKNYESWQELVNQWQSSVELLIEEYKHGLAVVDPQNPQRQCSYCGRQSLCRLYDQLNTVIEDE